MDREFEALLSRGAEELGVCLDDVQIRLMYRHMTLVREWNRRFNLTAIKRTGDIVVKHFIDSLSIIKFIPCGAEYFLDLGSGAGFPGIPAKIAIPGLNVVLLDSTGKKVVFIREVIDQLGIVGAKAVKARAEDLGRTKEYRETFDVCVARAVARLNVLLEYALPFVRVGGTFIAMKGREPGEEIEEAKKALEVLGGRVERVEKIVLPYSDIKRNVILIKKFRQMPAIYPRKSGIPSKQPLI